MPDRAPPHTQTPECACCRPITVESRKYRQRVRCRRFPPIVAMLRSCGEAPASNASRTNGTRSPTVGSAASSSIVTSAPTRNVSSATVIPRSGRRVMSTSRSGSSTPSFKTRSSSVVPPGEVLSLGVGAHQRHRGGHVVGTDVLERSHRYSLPRPATSRIAATMFGYAPQRQRLPLMNSRISSSEPARPSCSSATADMICPGVQ